MSIIDINFDVYSDTPKGKDPDTHSPTLRRYHKILWSKPLPNGANFDLDDTVPKYLHHNSELGEFVLASDSIGHTYSRVKSMSHIVDQIPPKEINSFFSLASTIGGFILFPARRINNKMTINGSRGFNPKIKDRFDLTLECIRRFYSNENSPLSDTLQRHSRFFGLFQDFKGYVDFFLLQDLVEENYLAIKPFLPFNGFDYPPLPNNVEEYKSYKKNMMDFLGARNQRMMRVRPCGSVG